MVPSSLVFRGHGEGVALAGAGNWVQGSDSNRRLPGYEPGVLPTELPYNKEQKVGDKPPGICVTKIYSPTCAPDRRGGVSPEKMVGEHNKKAQRRTINDVVPASICASR